MEYPAYYGGNITDDKEELIKEYEKKYNRKIPRQYVPLYLSYEDLKKQLDSIVKGTPRPSLKSAKSKTSKWTKMAEKKFGDKRSKEEIAEQISGEDGKRKSELLKGLNIIYDRGMKAYETSGSRPLQSPYSWGQARVYAVLFGSPARFRDKDVVEKYNIPLLSL
jgi:hypothetical protein